MFEYVAIEAAQWAVFFCACMDKFVVACNLSSGWFYSWFETLLEDDVKHESECLLALIFRLL